MAKRFKKFTVEATFGNGRTVYRVYKATNPFDALVQADEDFAMQNVRVVKKTEPFDLNNFYGEANQLPNHIANLFSSITLQKKKTPGKSYLPYPEDFTLKPGDIPPVEFDIWMDENGCVYRDRPNLDKD